MPSHRPSVFISHSHANRDVALELNEVLNASGVKTFFDQDVLDAADDLPRRIVEGIEGCDIFLLLWSSTACTSVWVDREWNTAYNGRKKIVPYKLDGTRLPQQLDNLIYVDRSDRDHSNAMLLEAVFGRGRVPVREDQVFPGRWKAVCRVPGVVGGSYDLELRRNGQVTGSGRMEAAGIFGDMMAAEGIQKLLKMDLLVRGNWSYDGTAKVLTIEMIVTGLGETQRDVITIQTTGYAGGAIQGQDLGTRTWTFEKVETERDKLRRALQGLVDRMRDRMRGTPGHDAGVEALVLMSLCIGAAGQLGLTADQVNGMVIRDAHRIDIGPLLEWLQRNGWVD